MSSNSNFGSDSDEEIQIAITLIYADDYNVYQIISGWEGATNDARIFLECISNPQLNFPMPPEGKYYLVDSGYANMPGFLSPYRGLRYHLRDYHEGTQPQRQEELFNYRHSSLRNVIERWFGVLKARFSILKKMSPYDLRTQRYIVTACCTLHNFIRSHSREDRLFEMYENENFIVDAGGISTSTTVSHNAIEVNVTQSQLQYMALLRDRVARELWSHAHDED